LPHKKKWQGTTFFAIPRPLKNLTFKFKNTKKHRSVENFQMLHPSMPILSYSKSRVTAPLKLPCLFFLHCTVSLSPLENILYEAIVKLKSEKGEKITGHYKVKKGIKLSGATV
jgi:hypothetical protein